MAAPVSDNKVPGQNGSGFDGCIRVNLGFVYKVKTRLRSDSHCSAYRLRGKSMIDLEKFQKTCHQLSRPLLVISGSRGCLTCGYLSMEAFERNGDAAAIVRGVDTYDDMLQAEIQAVSSEARALGVEPGMTGAEALSRFQ